MKHPGYDYIVNIYDYKNFIICKTYTLKIYLNFNKAILFNIFATIKKYN